MSDQSPQSPKVIALIQKLGFDPAKQPTGDARILSKVMDKIKAEREALVEKQVEDLVRKLMEIRQTMDKAKKEFDKQYQKHEKEVAKLLTDLDRIASGGADDPPPEDAPAEAKPEATQ